MYNDIQNNSSFDILITNGKIDSIAPAGEISQTVTSIDASGFIAIPGMIDIHIHGAGGFDSLDGTKKAFSAISRTLASVGTTSFLSTMVISPVKKNHHLQAASECTGKNMNGAELLGVYIEGPFINAEKRGGIVPECITRPSVSVLDKIMEEAGDALKIMCIAPEIPGNNFIIKRLRELGVIAAFGHSDADYEETKKGFDMGISHITHLFNCMRPLHHRDPGPLAAIFENPGISVELIGDSHHVHPSLVRIAWSLKGPGNLACVTDGISGMGLPEGTYIYNKKKYTSKEGLAKYLDGTFIGSTMSLGNIARIFLDCTGCSFRETIDNVTINPARMLGIENRKGSLEAGKDADIVLIDSSFNIQCTIIGGEPVYQNGNQYL